MTCWQKYKAEKERTVLDILWHLYLHKANMEWQPVFCRSQTLMTAAGAGVGFLSPGHRQAPRETT